MQYAMPQREAAAYKQVPPKTPHQRRKRKVPPDDAQHARASVRRLTVHHQAMALDAHAHRYTPVYRQALMKELTHRYKGHDVQDASFQQYGFGATQVTIR